MQNSAKALRRAERLVALSAAGCRNLPDETTVSAFVGKLRTAIGEAGATVVKDQWFSHSFPVQGLTIVMVLAESGVIIHTYPELDRGVTINTAVCGEVDPEVVCRNIEAVFEPRERISYMGPIPLMLPAPIE